MTRNQRLVLVWCEEHCSAAGIVKVSNTEIALIFDWSQQYTNKILKNLIENGNLEVLQKGTGHRPTKYRVPSVSHNQTGSRGNQVKVHQQVPSHNPLKSGPFSNNKIKEKDIAYPNTHIRKGDLFGSAQHVVKPVKTDNYPFQRFRRHWDRVEKWKCPDFVCYFSYVHKVRYGETPKLNWPVEVGAARTLLRRLNGDNELFKAFIQTAFFVSKRRPNGMRTFTYDLYYENVIAQDPAEDELAEYDDECVFPWLKAQLREESTRLQREYTAKLVRRSFGIYD